jgi:hypothetical protein
MPQQSEFAHVRRQDEIHVAQGIEILLALGVAWVRADKQAGDNETIAKALTSGE